jgi:Kef-type K+ transport system membrane component KefB
VSHSLELLATLALIVAAAKLAGATAARAGQPAVFGEIVAGLLLGPTAFNLPGWFVPHTGSPDLLGVLQDFADLGVILLMFVAGLETDLPQLRKVGGVAFWSAAGGVVLPLAGGTVVATAFGLPMFWQAVFVGTILTATSVSISAQTLMELGVLKSKEGTTILGAAIIDDVMGIVVLSIVVALAQSGGADPGGLAAVVARMALFFGAAWAGSIHFERIVDWGDRLPISQGLLATVVVIAFVYAWAAEVLGGIAAITGSYLAGVFFTKTRFKARIDAGIHPLTYSVLVPVFFVTIGLRANARTLGSFAAFTLALVVVAIVGKVVGCGLAARLCGFSSREAWRVGVGMISRGEVGLIVAGYGLTRGLVPQTVFSAAVLIVIATTMLTPPLLRAAFPRVEAIARYPVEEAIAHAPEEVRPMAEPG